MRFSRSKAINVLTLRLSWKVVKMLDKKKKEEVIKKFRTHANDTGSSEVQIAILTAEIGDLTGHLRQHKKDFSSRRGLIKKVIQRKRLLRYLEKENLDSFSQLTKKLKIKISTLFVPADEETNEEVAADLNKKVNKDKK